MEGRPKRALVVAAHPDDAEFTSGGTLARWAGEGADIRYVVCTDGSKGGDDLEIDDMALRDLREAEQRAAAETLGVRDVVFLRYPDGDLASASDLRRNLVTLIRMWRPDILLTWDAWRPYQLHPDHRATGLAAVDAVVAAGNPRRFPDLLPVARLPEHRVGEVYLFGTDAPDTWMDISETFERKLRAIACHRSQGGDASRVAAQMDGCNRRTGELRGVSYSEGFKVLHPFCEM